MNHDTRDWFRLIGVEYEPDALRMSERINRQKRIANRKFWLKFIGGMMLFSAFLAATSWIVVTR